MADTAEAPAEPQARHVVYCGVCSLPPEYCEFGGTVKKCQEWLEKNHPDMHQRLYSDETISANLNTLSLTARERAAKDAAKKEAKAALAETRNQERKAAAKVQIKRVERNKRKYVTVISGLEAHGLENKKIAKELGKKFATGSSVTKAVSGVAATAQGGSGEEITVQGDVSDDVFDWLMEVYGGVVPEDNVELVEDKKKKGGG
ncbi:Translation machinery-associated protein 22 [Onygenales sp. PD_40]|nr:Translation machinery-associated protein 22 [Onygenales sp. PD_40]KAK2777151.1 Translation machinery-associated protein 22 [Emmonsiellopsis sp. PD_33]KAK2796072.1 Translation machinery-associated protein 22 [Onygenales sp. PD_12]KAK2803797.1 Translation machinery-associated protein 22 [Onygenales sp. PD_10]